MVEMTKKCLCTARHRFRGKPLRRPAGFRRPSTMDRIRPVASMTNGPSTVIMLMGSSKRGAVIPSKFVPKLAVYLLNFVILQQYGSPSLEELNRNQQPRLATALEHRPFQSGQGSAADPYRHAWT